MFHQILVPTCHDFPFQNPPKSHQNSISKGIDFLIDFDIGFSTAQHAPRRPRTVQNADLSARLDPRRPQDGPKTAPRRPQEAAKRVPRCLKKRIPHQIFRSWPLRPHRADRVHEFGPSEPMGPSIFARLWFPKWIQVSTKMVSKIDENCYQTLNQISKDKTNMIYISLDHVVLRDKIGEYKKR